MENEKWEIREVTLNEDVTACLLAMSEAWAREENVYGYAANDISDIEGNRVFLAYDGEKIIGYVLGKGYGSESMRSVMAEGTRCFEVEELYVSPPYRSRGIGKRLMEYVEAAVKGEHDYITLTTATKNQKAILHFYIDEVGMTFWSARLFKRL